jgi:uncharacterized protein (TIGR03437 family)
MMRFSVLTVVACQLAGSSFAWAQSAAPTITPGGVVNAADYTAAVAPGMLIAVFGDSMASKVSSAAGTPLPTALDGTSVEVDGQAIPLFFVSAKQINAQMPFGVSGQVQVRVRTAVSLSSPATVTVVASAPRLFTKTMDGKGEPILVHNADWSLVSTASPARPGEYLILFLTGLGAVNPVIPAGQAGGDNDKYGPLNQLPSGAVTVAFGGKQTAILFAGLAPGWVGLYQINLQTPADMPRGSFALVASTKDGASQTGVLASAEGTGVPTTPTLVNLAVSLSTVTGGNPVTGTVTLSAAAPTGGLTIALRSNLAAATVPSSVVVAAGQASAQFSIATSAVPTAQIVTITASLGADSRTAPLTVTPLTGPVPTDLGGGVKMEFVSIPAGEFMMGCSLGDTECSADESPVHLVRITKPFEMGKYEVTQGQWQTIIGSNPSKFVGADLPVERVPWSDIQQFLTRLNARNDGNSYRLPSEAEWEYAARAGSTDKYAGSVLAEAAWYADNSSANTHPVGQKKANGWGLYDMLGNVVEWSQDNYASYAGGPVSDPTGPSFGFNKLFRGGSWRYSASYERVSSRMEASTANIGDNIGFRCVREKATASPLSTFRDYVITMTGTMTLAGKTIVTTIISGVPGIIPEAVVDTTADMSSGIVVYSYFFNPTLSGNTVTFTGTNGQGIYTNASGSGAGVITSGTLSLTATSPSVGTSVSGTLQFSTAGGSFNASFTGKIVSSVK